MKAQRETPGATKNTGERGERTRSDWVRQTSICLCRADSAGDCAAHRKNDFLRKVGVTLPGQCKKNIICSGYLLLLGPPPALQRLFCNYIVQVGVLIGPFLASLQLGTTLLPLYKLLDFLCSTCSWRLRLRSIYRYIGPRRDNIACLLRDSRLSPCFARTCTHYGLHEIFEHVLADLDTPPAAVRATAAVFQSGRSIGHPTIQECCL